MKKQLDRMHTSSRVLKRHVVFTPTNGGYEEYVVLMERRNADGSYTFAVVVACGHTVALTATSLESANVMYDAIVGGLVLAAFGGI